MAHSGGKYVVIVTTELANERWGNGKFDCILNGQIFHTTEECKKAVAVAKEQDKLTMTKYDYLIYPIWEREV